MQKWYHVLLLLLLGRINVPLKAQRADWKVLNRKNLRSAPCVYYSNKCILQIWQAWSMNQCDWIFGTTDIIISSRSILKENEMRSHFLFPIFIFLAEVNLSFTTHTYLVLVWLKWFLHVKAMDCDGDNMKCLNASRQRLAVRSRPKKGNSLLGWVRSALFYLKKSVQACWSRKIIKLIIQF